MCQTAQRPSRCESEEPQQRSARKKKGRGERLAEKPEEPAEKECGTSSGQRAREEEAIKWPLRPRPRPEPERKEYIYNLLKIDKTNHQRGKDKGHITCEEDDPDPCWYTYFIENRQNKP